jgi:hypothetical protein
MMAITIFMADFPLFRPMSRRRWRLGLTGMQGKTRRKRPRPARGIHFKDRASRSRVGFLPFLSDFSVGPLQRSE